MKKFSLLLCLMTLASFAQEYYDLPRVKLVHDGWGFQHEGKADPNAKSDRKLVMTTKYIKENIEMMERSIPGSGIIIRFTTPASKCEGRPVNINSIFGGRKIKYEYFKDDIANLKSTKFKKFTDNFIGLTVSPGNVDWFDDEAWEAVCHNHKVVARLAKETGMVGMKFDIEEYHKNTMWQFKPANGKTLAETHKKVRQRGQEFGRALFSEFPDMHMLCYWWFSLNRTKNGQSRPQDAEYMVAPFVNGVYDVLPPTVSIHDGNESCAYRANDEVEFYHLGIDVRKNFLRFIDPKNLLKYRAQTYLAPGLYVDPHFSGRANFWSNQLYPDMDRLGGVKLLKRNLYHAMEAADRYVWMWHERFVWFPSNHPANPVEISELAPKITEELDMIANPSVERAAAIVKEKKLKNTVYNHNFDKKAPAGNKNIPGFMSWFDKGKNKGKIEQQVINGNTVASFNGAVHGCIIQSRKVVPGEMYFVRCSAGNINPKSTAHATFAVRWKRLFPRDGKHFDDFFADYLNKTHVFRRLGSGKSETAEFVVIVPENATHMALVLTASRAQPDDRIYFDNLEAYKIMEP